MTLSIRYNIIRPIAWCLLMIMAGLLAACGFDEPDNPEPAPEPPAEVTRAVLVYMVANNSLGSSTVPGEEEYGRGFDKSDLREMAKAAREGSLGANRLLVYHHAYLSEPRMLEITPDGERELKKYDSSELSVSTARMTSVIDDFMELAPARNYGIVLWSHADGWLDNGIDEEAQTIRPKGFGVDGALSNKMNITTLAKVLERYSFDYVYFDCCHMAGVEVAYQLRNATPYIVGSVSELPSPGMPYDRTLPHLMADDVSAEDLTAAAKETFDFYNNQENPWDRTCTISVISTAGMEALADAIGAICDTRPELSPGYEGQRFIKNRCRYYDLGHYLLGLTRRDREDEGLPQREQLYAQAVKAINDVVVYKAATPWLWEGYLTDQVKIDCHCGLSTYIKRSADDGDNYGYRRLGWWTDVMSRMWP